MIDLRLSPDEIQLDAELSTLGFTILWVRWGLLTPERLYEVRRRYASDLVAWEQHNAKLNELLESDRHEEYDNEPIVDPPDSAKYVRWVTYDWLKEHADGLTDEQLDQLLFLCRSSWAWDIADLYAKLVNSVVLLLTDDQFERVCTLLLAHGRDETVGKSSVRRRLWRVEWDTDVRDQVLEYLAGSEQASIVNLNWKTELSIEDLQAFATRGSTKSVRVMAARFLDRRLRSEGT
ncbi:MAG: hypothetical protein AAGI53_16490 [Planctomycetota bacterium]